MEPPGIPGRFTRDAVHLQFLADNRLTRKIQELGMEAELANRGGG
jgi:hypothetical protein